MQELTQKQQELYDKLIRRINDNGLLEIVETEELIKAVDDLTQSLLETQSNDLEFLQQLIKSTTGYDKDFYYIDKVSLNKNGGLERAVKEFEGEHVPLNKDALNNLIEKLNNEPQQLMPMPPEPNYKFISITLAVGGELVVRPEDIDRVFYDNQGERFKLYLKNCDTWYSLRKDAYNHLKEILTSSKSQ